MDKFYKGEGKDVKKVDPLLSYTVIGTIVGARLGHCLFYEPQYYLANPIQILMVWKGGLASHGGAIGVFIALVMYCKKYRESLLWLLDRLSIPMALSATLIRLGNFFNSEIVGKETDSSFGVVFSKLGEDFARHPAQLYEAFSYILIFFIVAHIYWKTDKIKKTGYLFGLFFVLLWTSRFVVEFFKQAQVDGRDDWILGMNTGQTLSIPFILMGIYLMFRNKFKA